MNRPIQLPLFRISTGSYRRSPTATVATCWIAIACVAYVAEIACGQQSSNAEETKKAVDAAAELFGPSTAPATSQPPASSEDKSTASSVTEPTTTPSRDAVQQGTAEKGGQPKSGNIIDSLFGIFSGQPIEDASADQAGSSELEAKPSSRMSIDAITGLSDSDGDDSSDRVNSRDQVIKVVSGYEEGARLAQLNRRPLLVLLGAEWCVWCRKLEAELETTAAEPILKKWIVCKVDVDKDPDTAARFEAASLPGLRIVGFDGEVSASREGYLPADELSAWLDQNGDKVDPVMQQLLFAQKRPSASDVKKLVQFLGHRRPAVRSAAQQRLESHVSTSAGGIVDALRGGSLVQRLSALEVLERAGAPVAGLDPWNPKSLDEVDWQPLIDWARQAGEQKGKGKKSNSQPESEENQQSALTPELETSLRGIIDRLLAADGSRREALLVEASASGASIIGLIRARLSTDSNLSDSHKQALRELMFRAAAGRATRLEFAALLSALARLDVQTRREAALRLAPLLSSEDQLLIDELARDSDPVVREAAVAAEFKTGGLRSQTRIAQLLSDPDANVRSAVLRVLQEKSSPGAIVAVVDHLDHEPNEDLLVLSVKVAAGDKELGVGLDAVMKMLGHEKWRVRAAALDAVKQLTTDDGGLSGENVLPPAESKKLFTAVLQRIEDSDEFVAASARELLTSIFDGSTADLFLDYLTAHPDQLSRLQGDDHDWSLERRKPHLVSAAAQVLKSGSGKKLETAATLLALLAPENVKFELPKLLESESNQVRIAGLKSILAIVSLQRAEDVKLGAAAWLVRHNAEKRKQPNSLSPWVPVPESFLKLSGAANGFESDMDQGAEPETVPDEPQPSIASVPRMAPPGSVPAISPEREDALNAAADLFGPSASASIASPPAVVDPTTNKVIAPSPSKDQALDAASALFGQVPKPDLPTPGPAESDKVQPSASIPSNALPRVNSNIGGINEARAFPDDLPIPSPPIEFNGEFIDANSLPTGGPTKTSEWLEEWWSKTAKGEAAWDGYAWVVEVLPLIDKLRSSDDAEVAEWARLAWFVLGHATERDAMGEAARRAAQDRISDTAQRSSKVGLEHYLPWIDAKVRRDIVLELIASTKQFGDAEDAIMKAALIVDDPVLGDTLFNAFGAPDSNLSKDRQRMHGWLMWVYGGEPAQSRSYWANSNPSDEAFHDLDDDLPTDEDAAQRMKTRFASARSEHEKIAAFALASRFDFRNTTATAVGIVSNATEWNTLTEHALHLALGDSRPLSVRRAGLWITHPVSEVREFSIQFLFERRDAFDELLSESTMMQVYDYSDNPTPLSYLNEAPSEVLLPPGVSESERSQAYRACLAAARNERSDYDVLCAALEKHGVNSEIAQLQISLCLTLGRRVDPATIEFYRKAAEKLSDAGHVSYLYSGLKRLPGKAGEDIRSEFRKKYGNAIAPNSAYDNSPF